MAQNRKAIDSFTLTTVDKTWVRQESVTTQTSPTIQRSNYGQLVSQNSQDDPDLLEVLSLCEGTNDEEDFNDDNESLTEERRMEKSIDASTATDSSSSYAKSSSAERDDDPDIVLLRRHNRLRAPSACSLQNERLHAISFPVHYSDKSLNGSQTGRSDSGSAAASSENGSHFSPRRPFGLQITNEPFQNILELPSPSSASLHSGHGNIVMQELTTKSNSAPILLKKERKRDDFTAQPIVSHKYRATRHYFLVKK